MVRRTAGAIAAMRPLRRPLLRHVLRARAHPRRVPAAHVATAAADVPPVQEVCGSVCTPPRRDCVRHALIDCGRTRSWGCHDCPGAAVAEGGRGDLYCNDCYAAAHGALEVPHAAFEPVPYDSEAIREEIARNAFAYSQSAVMVAAAAATAAAAVAAAEARLVRAATRIQSTWRGRFYRGKNGQFMADRRKEIAAKAADDKVPRGAECSRATSLRHPRGCADSVVCCIPPLEDVREGGIPGASAQIVRLSVSGASVLPGGDECPRFDALRARRRRTRRCSARARS